ncbi:MAG: polysaccharide deacetylase family protein [Chitinivibrionales bacterium]|nr:polysaccharide deacetylase family protein [Chitinivibrionales bacterium]
MPRSVSKKKRVRRAWIITLIVWIAVFSIWVLSPLNPFLLLVSLITGLAISRYLLSSTRKGAVAVLNYHSVSHNPAWLRIGEQLSIHPRQFERQLRYLKQNNYETLTIPELYDYLSHRSVANKSQKKIVLTFDDGYADNFVTAFPLLKKYDMKATIFVSTDFILKDAQGARHNSEEGYLRESHIKQMVKSGLVDIQSHGVTHTRVFNDDKSLGFHHGQLENIWLFWNNRPRHKTEWWQHDLTSFALHGYPLHKQGPALTDRKFCVNEQVINHLHTFAAQRSPNKHKERNSDVACRQELQNFLASASLPYGSFETHEEYDERIRGELEKSREQIEKLTNKPVAFLCWPQNEYSQKSLNLAAQCGYKATVSNFFSSSNCITNSASTIGRVYVGAPCFGTHNPYAQLLGFHATIKCFEGSYVWYPVVALSNALNKLFFKQTEPDPFMSIQDQL